MSSAIFLTANATAEKAPQTVRSPARAAGLSAIAIECVDLDQATRIETAWSDLTTRACEPNVFLDPAFAIPLALHCQNKDISFLLAWTTDLYGNRDKLVGLLPLALPRGPISRFARIAAHPHAPLGVPLLDRAHGPEVLRQMLAWVTAHHPHVEGLIIASIPREGPVFALLQDYASSQHTELHPLALYERAVISKDEGLANFPHGFISSKRRANYRKQRRRLSKLGSLTYRSVSEPFAVQNASEAFLKLEYKGWKGTRKTALLTAADETAFFRTMTRLMALRGKCRIDSFEIDGEPVAMGVVLNTGDRAFYWKTCYDESHCVLSPGVQLTLDLTRTQLTLPGITLTDSCATPNHSMISHIWRERMEIADIVLPLGPRRGPAFHVSLARETLRRRLRDLAKSAWHRILRRRA